MGGMKLRASAPSPRSRPRPSPHLARVHIEFRFAPIFF